MIAIASSPLVAMGVVGLWLLAFRARCPSVRIEVQNGLPLDLVNTQVCLGVRCETKDRIAAGAAWETRIVPRSESSVDELVPPVSWESSLCAADG